MKRNLCPWLALFLVLGAASGNAFAQFTQAELSGSWTGTLTSEALAYNLTFYVDDAGNLTGFYTLNGNPNYLTGMLDISNQKTGLVAGSFTLFNAIANSTPPTALVLTAQVDVTLAAGGGITGHFDTNISSGTAGIYQAVLTNVAAGPGTAAGGAPVNAGLKFSAPLTITNVAGGPVPVAGVPVKVTTTIENAGTSAISGFYVSFFQNLTDTVTSSTGSVVMFYVGGLAAGATENIVVYFIYPAQGDFSLAAVADADGQLLTDLPSNTLNSYVYLPVVVDSPSFNPVILSVTEDIAANSTTFTVNLQNQGMVATTAQQFSLLFYGNSPAQPAVGLPADQTLPVPAMAANAKAIVTVTAPPPAITGGQGWFVLALTANTSSIWGATSLLWGATTALTINSPLSTTAASNAAQINTPVNFSVTATAPGAQITYTWVFGDGTSTITTTPTTSHSYAAPGIFLVSVTAAVGGAVTSASTLEVDITPVPINLGTVSISAQNGKVSLAVPAPKGFTKVSVKSKVVGGDPGNTVVYRKNKLRGTVATAGVFTFTVEYDTAKKPVNTVQEVYFYTVVP
jgi:hypothetical protein